MRLLIGAILCALLVPTWGQETLVFEAEDVSSPSSAWAADTGPVDLWNLWSKDNDADKKWSGGVVLQSPPVMVDRETPEDGAPVLHTVITDIPDGKYRIRIKYGRGLAASLDQETWTKLSGTGGVLGNAEVTEGTLEFWVDDRFADEKSPGFSYYDCIYLTPLLAEKNGVTNGDFAVGKEMPGSGWGWFTRDQGAGKVEFSDAGREGSRCARIEHTGERDWAFSNVGRLDVEPGQAWIVSAWVKCENTETIDLAVVALSGGQTMRWDIGSTGTSGTRDWTRLEATAYVPPGCDQIHVRFVGLGACTAWVDDIALEPGEALTLGPREPVQGWAQTRAWERIDRGMLAMPVEGGKVYIGWRLLATDPDDVAFNVYRGTGRMRPVKLNDAPIVGTTDFVDADAPLQFDNAYWVRAVVGGKEQNPSSQATVRPAPEVKPYLSLKLDGDHKFQKAGIADLNGDGQYDFVIKQPGDNIDPYRLYWTPSPDTYKIEAYLHDGTFLWRNDLGWSIERGIWYSPYLVWDLDGDGKAEVIAKTGEGDPRSEDGRVREGPEYVSVWDGMTGQEVARADWPSRDGFGGGSGYNYSSRNQLGIAYLDGKTPCLMVARGTYTVMKLDAYQYHDGKLERLWSWDSRMQPGPYRGQGAHFMHTGDLDGDGRDEVVLGSSVIDDNGSGLWTTGLGHPDHCYMGDIDPSRPGLEIYYGVETSQSKNAVCLVDAKTGEIIWGIDEPSRHVHGTGLCSDLDPLNPGMECYSGEKEYPADKPHRWLHSAAGKLLADEASVDLGLTPRAVYWDADPQRELLRGGRISNYLGGTLSDSVEGGHAAWADILGDWREEIITSVAGELRIYTTTIPASDRRVCLMQDPLYRTDVAHLAMGYAQPPMTSTCFGGRHTTLGLRFDSTSARMGQTTRGHVVAIAPADQALTGTVQLRTGTGATLEPSSLELSVPAGEVREYEFALSVPKPDGLLTGSRSVSVQVALLGQPALGSSSSLPIEDEPMSGVPIAQAEAFGAQAGGEVMVREDKVGALGKSFSHWDLEGHSLTWSIDIAEEGEYALVVRYCSPGPVTRTIQVDGGAPLRQTFPATGGFSSSANEWAHATVKKPDGALWVLKLSAGEHELTLTNADGQGMNLDYVALVPSRDL